MNYSIMPDFELSKDFNEILLQIPEYSRQAE